MPEENKVKSLNGYSLFNDVEDETLKARNRGVTIANIIEDNLTEDGLVDGVGMQYVLQYWMQIAKEERAEVYEILQKEVQERKLIEGGI